MDRSASGGDTAIQVLISGAGPTGLLLAAELQRRGVDCQLIDELDAPRGWDRATVVHPRSLEIFDALGLAERFLEQGVRTTSARFYSNDEVLGDLDLELADSPYPFDLGLSEEVTEGLLSGYLESVGGSVTRSTRLVEFDQGPDGVTATLERDGASFDVEAEWLVGCDGLHSVVREQSGIEFAGSDIDAPWAVFDAMIAGWDRGFGIAQAFLDVPPVILTPLPDRRWRVYMRPSSDESDLVAEARETVQRYAPHADFTDIENPTRFHCHSRIAEHYRSGRVLLAGDAAHVCSPAEGHGMNTGIQDAFNLGWKLALVCRGIAGKGLLDTYESERRPVAERIVGSGAEVEAGQSLTDDAARAERDASIRLIYGDPETAHHEAAAAAEIDRSYEGSPIISGEGPPGATAGALLTSAARVDHPATGPSLLHQLGYRPGHTVVVVGGAQADPGVIPSLVERLEAEHADSSTVDAVFGFSTRPEDGKAGRIDKHVAERLGVDSVTVLAIRPDRYVGLRHDGADTEPVARYLESLTR
jgi:2-polyprenyl-6-methoxyphenol hydroxylase-like FAD-dependent oxidoreductase